jgi:signal peptidase I
MGDNRDNSVDSRFDPGQVPAGGAACPWNAELDRYLPPETGMGFIPFDNLVGRAERILFSWDGKKGLRLDRTMRSLSAPKA